ncbi:MAG: WbqC family protein [Hyphomicrobium sp.]
MKKLAIVQSNYIPWKGYFDMIAAVDEFVLYDDMQYTRRDWRNRNRIKTPSGLVWLTVPVKVKGRFTQTIRETEIDGTDWLASHWKSLELNYKRARFFDEVSTWLKPLYLDQSYENLSALNRRFIEAICNYLDLHTTISNSWNYTLLDGKTERLVDLCVQAGASEYISGPAARDYVDPAAFQNRNIKLTWFDYSGYPDYPQLWDGFTHEVTILDLLFNCGKSAPRYMKHVRSSG